jgi:DNA-3-methyladenine glycosylase I
MGGDGKTRCAWAESNDLLRAYHDEEWGVQVHDDRLLFEMLNLEGAQAGLSWQTILSRRDGYRAAFDNFEAERVATYDEDRQADLLHDARIIRNRLKIAAVIENARATLRVRDHAGSLDAYLWGFTAGGRLTRAQHPLAQDASKRMSKAMKRDGFRFVGPTTCYAFMQAVGMIDDHSPDCFRSGR